MDYIESILSLTNIKMTIQNSLLFCFFIFHFYPFLNVLAQVFWTVFLPAHRRWELGHFLFEGWDYPRRFSLVLLHITRPFYGDNLHSLIMLQISQGNFATWKGKPWKFLTLKHSTKKSPGGPLPSALRFDLHSRVIKSVCLLQHLPFRAPSKYRFFFFFGMKSN